MFKELEEDLCELTGYDRISFQPNRFVLFGQILQKIFIQYFAWKCVQSVIVYDSETWICSRGQLCNTMRGYTEIGEDGENDKMDVWCDAKR